MQSTEVRPNSHQRLAGQQGAWFHMECIHALTIAGFEIASERVPLYAVGIELDAITNNRHGVAMPWEFKGSWNGTRPGLYRTDSVKKAIANAYLLRRWENASGLTPMILMTSHSPTAGSASAMLHSVSRDLMLGVVDPRDSRALTWLSNATEEELLGFVQDPLREMPSLYRSGRK